MTLAQILQLQLTDLFRIGLIIALVATMLRTQAQSGTVVPLAAGVLFVAVILPVTMGTLPGEPVWRQVAAGLVSNTILLGVVLGLWQVIRRLRGG